MSTIKVSDIWAEDLFRWFFEHVKEACGDGCAAIVCSNYTEVADWFLKWLEGKEPLWFKYFHKPDRSFLNQVNFHDNNENFIFTDDKDIGWPWHDYVFIVVEDCVFAHEYYNKEVKRTIKAVK